MKHLGILRLLDKLIGFFTFLGALGVLGGLAWVGKTQLDIENMSGAIMYFVGGACGFLTMMIVGMAYWMTGNRIARARWRIPQTILVIPYILNFPFGTAYAGYAIWACWMNAENKEAFEQGGLDADL